MSVPSSSTDQMGNVIVLFTQFVHQIAENTQELNLSLLLQIPVVIDSSPVRNRAFRGLRRFCGISNGTSEVGFAKKLTSLAISL